MLHKPLGEAGGHCSTQLVSTLYISNTTLKCYPESQILPSKGHLLYVKLSTQSLKSEIPV